MWVVSEVGKGSNFSFTLPLYSLANLLLPVITHEGRLRDAIVLIKVELIPVSDPPKTNWKDICRQARRMLRRCVYPNKDLVLPTLGSTGLGESMFVVASTNLESSEAMMKRIREQLLASAGLREAGIVKVSASLVNLPAAADRPLEELVQAVANRIAETTRL